MTGERREFVDNRSGNTVADAICQAAAYFGNSRELAIANALFNGRAPKSSQPKLKISSVDRAAI